MLNMWNAFVFVAMLPWGTTWLLAVIWQWVVALSCRRGTTSENKLRRSTAYALNYQEPAVPDAVDMPWYARLLFGLPPTKGKITLGAAAVQLASLTCAVINWVWLGLAGGDPWEIQGKVGGFILATIFPLLILGYQKLAASWFSKSQSEKIFSG